MYETKFFSQVWSENPLKNRLLFRFVVAGVCLIDLLIPPSNSALTSHDGADDGVLFFFK